MAARRHSIALASALSLALGACVYDWSSSTETGPDPTGSSSNPTTTSGGGTISTGTSGGQSYCPPTAPAEGVPCPTKDVLCGYETAPDDDRVACQKVLVCGDGPGKGTWKTVVTGTCDAKLPDCVHSGTSCTGSGFCFDVATKSLCSCAPGPNGSKFTCQTVEDRGSSSACPEGPPPVGTACAIPKADCVYSLCPASISCDGGDCAKFSQHAERLCEGAPGHWVDLPAGQACPEPSMSLHRPELP